MQFNFLYLFRSKLKFFCTLPCFIFQGLQNNKNKVKKLKSGKNICLKVKAWNHFWPDKFFIYFSAFLQARFGAKTYYSDLRGPRLEAR